MPSLQIDIEDAQRPIRVLQITDCHVGPTDEETLLGLNTSESLHDVIQHIREQEAPFDLLLTTGDISNNGGTRTYKRFLDIIRSSNIEHNAFAWLPGNHDSPEDMNEALGTDGLIKEIRVGNWLIVLLNTQVPGHVHGNLISTELDTLDNLLSSHKDRHAIVFMHHQPVPVGCAWVDQQKVRSAYAFFKIVDQYKHVKAVAWGHVHQEFADNRNGIRLMSTPSTCIQFKANSDDFAVDTLMPGYRWLELHPDGTITTEVVRIPRKAYPIEFTSEGY